MFQHACTLGCEGIVSKRLGSRYCSGRSPDWLKFKNPAAPAVRREAEEDWGGNTFLRAAAEGRGRLVEWYVLNGHTRRRASRTFRRERRRLRSGSERDQTESA